MDEACRRWPIRPLDPCRGRDLVAADSLQPLQAHRGNLRSEPRRPRYRTWTAPRPLGLTGPVLGAYIHPNGAVAQLGERCNRTAEVDGSIPFGSTIKVINKTRNINKGQFGSFAAPMDVPLPPAQGTIFGT